MPVTVNVVMEGLPGRDSARMYPVSADQKTPLEDLNED